MYIYICIYIYMICTILETPFFFFNLFGWQKSGTNPIPSLWHVTKWTDPVQNRVLVGLLVNEIVNGLKKGDDFVSACLRVRHSNVIHITLYHTDNGKLLWSFPAFLKGDTWNRNHRVFWINRWRFHRETQPSQRCSKAISSMWLWFQNSRVEIL